MTDKIFIHINDLETSINKKLGNMKALKRWVAKMPGLFPKQTIKPWLELTRKEYEALSKDDVLFISLTPAGTSYARIPASEMEKALSLT